MSVSFRLKLKEKVFELTADPEEGVWAVKERMAVEMDIEAGLQKWIYKGRIVTNEQTVGGASIANEDTIIVMKASGAPSAPPAGAAAASSTNPSAASSSSSASSGAAANPSGSGAISPSTATAPPLVATPQFNMAMHHLLSNEESVAQSSVELLLKVVTNIVNHPMEDKFRRMRSSNATFGAKLGNVNGGNACMQALGFELTGDDWVLTPTADKWNNIVACQAKLTSFSQRMNGAASASSSTASAAVSTPSGTVAGTAGATAAAASSSSGESGPGEKVSEADTQQQVLLMAMMQSVMLNKKEEGASEGGESKKSSEEGDGGSNEKDS
jgi:ubiquilin